MTRSKVGWISLCVVGLLFTTGCKRKEPQPREDGPAQVTTQPVAPAPPAVVDEATPSQDDAPARALLDAWLRAQNAGDFAAYEELYAARFTGVKRVGARMQRFDRAGWLADRKAMFARSFSVQAADVQVSVSGNTALVEFTQTWSSASFRDVGTKHMVLVEQEGNWRISSEEMRSSSTGGAKTTIAPPEPREFSLVVEAPEPLLLLSSEVDLNAVTGTPLLTGDTRVRREVVTQALPKELQTLVGERFALYGAEGVTCEGTVSGFEVLVDLQPHFGMINHWEGRVTPGQVASSSERALDLWRLSERGGRFLVARLKTEGGCAGARWARATTLPKPKLWSWRESSAQEREAVLATVRASPLHRRLQKEFEAAYPEKKTPWDDSGSSARFAFFEDEAGQVFASLTASSGVDDSCASPFDADAFYLLQKRGTGWTIVSGAPEDHVDSAWPRFLEPLRADMAFDLDGDGRPEFVGGRDFFRESGGKYRSVLNLSPAYFDCPC